ncbi:class F sortase [Actinomycetospora termitidis]|uniref:Class F sortase n=1 Tax=Actinomycetospora termitidis TaxID=3053470 RepID=A0ABT7MB16_9PSEU|nr:class F sortase [Actinomycetospora sp. Odt1-22]MDL5157849.1 class F sortase [Actinomycetospora sp. Odt1-22]
MTRTRSPLLIWVLAIVAAAVTLTVLMTGPGSARTGTTTVSAPAGAAVESLPLAASAPTGIEIPAIGLTRDSVMKLGYNEDLSLQVPPDAATVGWFSRGAAPGTNGPAVFASHVNYHGAEGGFAHLDDLTAGDQILVHRADGSSVAFVVDRVEQASKQAFPTAQVYGPTGDAQIRLITCGGQFDADRRSYEDNVIVFGHAERAWR